MTHASTVLRLSAAIALVALTLSVAGVAVLAVSSNGVVGQSFGPMSVASLPPLAAYVAGGAGVVCLATGLPLALALARKRTVARRYLAAWLAGIALFGVALLPGLALTKSGWVVLSLLLPALFVSSGYLWRAFRASSPSGVDPSRKAPAPPVRPG